MGVNKVVMPSCSCLCISAARWLGICHLGQLKLRSEDVEGRADPVLAATVSRLRWAGSHCFSRYSTRPFAGDAGFAIGLGYGWNSGKF